MHCAASMVVACHGVVVSRAVAMVLRGCQCVMFVMRRVHRYTVHACVWVCVAIRVSSHAPIAHARHHCDVNIAYGRMITLLEP